jgi:serine/threonine protein kinase
LPPGSKLDRYVLLGKLGEGAMGVLYAAYDPFLDRRIAIKLVRHCPDSATERVRQTHLLREARALAQLSHPHVVSVYDVGVASDRVYVAMELLAGTSLRQWLGAAPRSPREILNLFVQAGRGLAAAHERRLLHRDFKPDNVLVTAHGTACVVDFGLAVRLPARSGSACSDPGPWLPSGTPGYLAPECYEGTYSPASDQYSFCVALYECLAGHTPFRSSDPDEPDAIAEKLAGRMAPLPVGAPRPLAQVLRRGLAPQPEQRWPAVAALVDALEDCLRPRGLLHSLRRWRDRPLALNPAQAVATPTSREVRSVAAARGRH